MSKDMSDELDEIFFEHGVILHPSDIEMDLERKTYFKQAIEAYISKHYIKKEDVLECLPEKLYQYDTLRPLQEYEMGYNTAISAVTTIIKMNTQLNRNIEKLNLGKTDE